MKKLATFARTLNAAYRALVRRLYQQEALCYRATSSWFRGLSSHAPSPAVLSAGETLPAWMQREIDAELDMLALELEAPPALRFPARVMRQLASLAA